MQSKEVGSGSPIVLVGGGLTGWSSWEPHADRLRASRRVLLLQPINVQWGLEGRALPADYSVESESRGIAAALEGAHLTAPVDVVAWSYGGLAALDFALDHPERIRTLTLIEPPALWVLHAAGLVDDEVNAVERQLRGRTGDISEEQLESFLVVAGLVPPGTQARSLPQWPTWNRHRQSLRNSAAVLRHRDDLSRLRGFARPVLLVKGTGSAPWLHKVVDRIGAEIPNARVAEMPGGHAPHIVSMDRFFELLAELQASTTR